MDALRRFLSFVAGLILILFGFLGECPRAGAVVIGFLLMGMFTVPEALGILRGRVTKEDE
jgi:hypothetical protein